MPEPVLPQLDSTHAPVFESLLATSTRRIRYVVAIIVSTILLLKAAWWTIMPPANYAGLTLLGWPNAIHAAGVVVLVVALAVAVLVSMILTHPDSPHIGIFCSMLGLGLLSIRGGVIHLLLRTAQDSSSLGSLRTNLALECIMWLAFLVIIERFAHLLHKHIFFNTAWLERIGADPELKNRPQSAVLYPRHLSGLLFFCYSIGKTTQEKLSPLVSSVGAFLAATLFSYLLLNLFMQSQLKGQVFFAICVSFLFAGLFANLLFPRSSYWALWAAVPATAMIGYLTSGSLMRYPGFSADALSRALPVDYFSMGIPGVIYGYYWALHLRVGLTHVTEEI